MSVLKLGEPSSLSAEPEVTGNSTHSRRRFLALGATAVASLIVPSVALARVRVRTRWDLERSLSFYNLHTDERLRTTYFQDGEYVPGALNEINYILRDFRQNEIKPIDPNLLDLLVQIHHRLGTNQAFDVISGYRSPKTNAMLRGRSEGVAMRSMHIEGRAIDIVVPGRSLRSVRMAAISFFSGGVGYYPGRFVHVDTGRIRYW
jgi:uncharacterized protein YcbK (DUF882 family)